MLRKSASTTLDFRSCHNNNTVLSDNHIMMKSDTRLPFLAATALLFTLTQLLSSTTMTMVESFALFVPQQRQQHHQQPVLHSTAVATAEPEVASVAPSSASARVVSQSSCGTVNPDVVDMNMYNLDSLETIMNEWTAELVPANAFQDTGVYLGAKSKTEIFVDEVKVVIPRSPDQGLGIELMELYGGREDGVGITLIQDFVAGGLSEHSGLLPGDSISQIDVVRRSSTSAIEGRDEMVSVATECFDYDRTIDAILSLPPPTTTSSEEERYILTVKRLRRKPKVVLNLQYPPNQQEDDIRLELFAGENLRRAMLARGVKLNDALAKRFDNGGTGDCGSEGTCATCAVAVLDGNDDSSSAKTLLNPPANIENQLFKETPRWRLACKTTVGYGMTSGELTVRVNPRQWD